jgi:hypothetical protein
MPTIRPALLLGHFNRIYGITADPDTQGANYRKPGFILD